MAYTPAGAELALPAGLALSEIMIQYVPLPHGNQSIAAATPHFGCRNAHFHHSFPGMKDGPTNYQPAADVFAPKSGALGSDPAGLTPVLAWG
ncbi:hypothetical protein E7V67_009100 [[Empedobacter] haloabium]|uniref:Uncharacterized protein n=1 Tax=[Empedobacter] haloabium TaxID=592317 RepID=A0ABZ1URT8_9BURK